MKLKGLVFSLDSVVACGVAMIVFGIGAFAGHTILNNYRTTALISQLDTIDRALEMYSRNHINVKKSSITVDSQNLLSYNTTKIYPSTLKELGVVRDEQGYFSQNIDLSKFRYSTNTSNDEMTYELGVVLPDGNYQKSKKSNK